MSLMDSIKAKAKANRKHILLPEGAEERTVQAAARITAEGIAKVTLLGKRDEIEAVAKKFNVSLDGIDTINPTEEPDYERYCEWFYEMRKAKGVTPEKAHDMIANPLFYAAMLIKDKKADGFVSGAINTTGEMFGIMVGATDTSHPSIFIRDGARIEADLAAIGAVNGRDGELARAIAEHWQKSFLDADNPLCLYQGGRDAPELAGSGIPDSRTHAFVVLGYELMDGQMQSELVGRCEAAAAAARSYPSAILVCSGGATGPNNPEGHTEAGLMKQYLTEQCGIDEGRIFIDERAMTTQENAVNTFEILKEQGVHTMTIVTSSYHQRWGESVYHTLAELCRREGYPVEMVGSYSYETEPTVEAFRQSAQIAAMQMAGILQLPGGRGGMRPPRS